MSGVFLQCTCVLNSSGSTPKQYNVAGDFTFGDSSKKRKREGSEETNEGIAALVVKGPYLCFY